MNIQNKPKWFRLATSVGMMLLLLALGVTVLILASTMMGKPLDRQSHATEFTSALLV